MSAFFHFLFFLCVLDVVLYIFSWVLLIYLCDAFGLFCSTMPCCVEDFLWHLDVSFFEDFLELLQICSIASMKKHYTGTIVYYVCLW